MRRRDGAHPIGGGWWARRGDGGTVTLWAGDDGPEQTFTAAEWARIVAAVSALPNCYQSALALHQGDTNGRPVR